MKNDELKEKIDKLAAEMEKLEPARKRYFEASNEKYKLEKEYSERLYRHEITVLKMKTKYKEPEYPSMGYAAENGYAYFENREDAEKLQKLLVKRSYTYGYTLVWDGPGEYVVEPDYRRDHDGDIIYTATFKKVNGIGENESEE